MITRHRVLLVDDDAERIAAASVLVGRLGHEVRATSCDACTELVAAFDPDLVIADASRSARWLADLLADGRSRPLLVAGVGERSGLATTPFDTVLAWPLHPYALLRLSWHVEVRRVSRGKSRSMPRVALQR